LQFTKHEIAEGAALAWRAVAEAFGETDLEASKKALESLEVFAFKSFLPFHFAF